MPTAAAPVRSRADALALFSANLALAHWSANRALYRRPGVARKLLRRMDRSDIDQLARLALWRCCQVWDPERGTLATLVAHSVLQSLVSESLRRRGSWDALSFASFGGDDSDPYEPATPDEADPLAHADDVGLVEHYLDLLPRRWSLVLSLRHGLRGHQPHGLREVGEHLGVSHARVGQIERRALERLRRAVQRLRLPVVG